jgi:hypothetical protein
MPTKMIKVHIALGLTDAEAEAVLKEVDDLQKNTELITDALDVLTAKYDAKTLLVGMRLMQVINQNSRMHQAEQAKSAEQAFIKAFGHQQNPKRN